MAKTETVDVDESVDAIRAPYIPWKTFEHYAASLKKVGTPPHTLDNSARPSSMSGGLWRALVSGLKFLKLVEPDGEATDKLAKLVKAHGTPEWTAAVKQYVVPAYAAVVGDLPVKNATVAQLDARFKAHSKLDGQMLRKAERFYLHALRDAGIEYSPLFAMRRESTGGNGKRKSTIKKSSAAPAPEPLPLRRPAHSVEIPAETPTVPAGMIDLPIPIDDHSFIRVPRSITGEQMALVNSVLGTVKAMADRNDKAASMQTD
jgi:hypothetical protein